MNTVVADSNFLKNILQYLTKDLFTPAIIQRSKMYIENQYDYHTVELQIPYKASMNKLINDLSSLITMPDQFVARFNQEPAKLQLFLYDRYLGDLDVLGPDPGNQESYVIPKALDELFKWFFITLWGD